MMNTEAELKKIKSSLESAKTELAETNGKIDTFDQRLKDEYETESLEDAESSITEMKGELSSVDKETEEGMKELSESYEW